MRGLLIGVGSAVAVAIVATLGAIYVVSPGGAPQYPSHGSWVDQAHTALDSVASDVATAQLLLRLAERDRLMGNYQQIVALDAENEAGKVSDHLAGEQTHPADDATYNRVTTVLSDASDLLSSVRVAIVRRDDAKYGDLGTALKKMQTRLSKAEEQVPS
jgi:hypothetical protein